MDQEIQGDINILRIENNYEWLDPVIEMEDNTPNPYYSGNRVNKNIDKSFSANPIGKVYMSPMNIMNINFKEFSTSNLENKDDSRGSKQIELSQFVTRRRSSVDLNSPNMIFQLSSSMIFDLNRHSKIPTISGFIKDFPIKLAKVDCNFEFIGPIMFSAFLYSSSAKTILTETWNFFPNQSINFLKEYNIKFKNHQTAIFQVDPLKSAILFVFLSHPVTKDKCSYQNDYYFDPNKDNSILAKSELNKAKKNGTLEFSTFGFTFFDFNYVRQATQPLMGPSCYLIDKIPPEKQISQLVSEANGRRLKQIQLKIWLMKDNENESPYIIHHIFQYRPQPFVSPVNECTVQIDSLTISGDEIRSNDYGYIVIVEFHDGQNKPIKCIHSKFDFQDFTESFHSRICFPSLSSSFSDSFLIDLPYPCSPSSYFYFRLIRYYFNVRGNDPKIDEIGTATHDLFQKDSLLFTENVKTVTIHDNYKITFKLFVRSNAYVPDINLYNFLSDKNPSFDLLKSIPVNLLTIYLHAILNKMFEKLESYADKDFMNAFIGLCETITAFVDKKKFSKFLITYARFFAFLSDFTPKSSILANNCEEESDNSLNKHEFDLSKMKFHSKIILLMTNFLKQDKQSIITLSSYIDFFLTMIGKFLVHDQSINEFGPEYTSFITTFVDNILQIKDGENISSNMLRSFGIFINLLYDAEYYDISIKTIQLALSRFTPNEKFIKLKYDFIEATFKPSLFALFSRNSKIFKEIIQKLVKQGYEEIPISPEPGRLFDIILRLTEIYDSKINESVATNLIPCAIFFSPKHFSKYESLLSPLVFFLYLLMNSKIIPSNDDIFSGLHFLVKKVSKKEVLHDNIKSSRAHVSESPLNDVKLLTQKHKHSGNFSPKKKAAEAPSTFRTMQPSSLIANKKEKTKANLFTKYIYESVFELIDKFEKLDINAPLQQINLLTFHLITVATIDDLQINLFNVLINLLSKHKMQYLNTKSPATVRILTDLLKLTENKKSLIPTAASFIKTIFLVDFECSKNIKRSFIILLRCLVTFDKKLIISKNFKDIFSKLGEETPSCSYLSECVNFYNKLYDISLKLINAKTQTPEKKAELLMEKFSLFSKSPDSQVAILEILYKHHIKHFNYPEASFVSLLQSAIIFENLTIWKKIPNYFNIEHPCLIFGSLCSLCQEAKCSDEYMSDPPLVPGFCDSSRFNEQGVFSLIYRILDLCEETKLIDLSTMLIDLCWPVFEYWHSFTELKNVFAKFQKLFNLYNDNVEDQKEYTDNYFRVTLFGERLKDENGKMYIYRTKPLTHIVNFTEYILGQYKAIFGKDCVEQIKEGKKVDTSTLNLKFLVYIQVTFVNPLTSSRSNIQTFYLDLPFLKDSSNHLQGTIEKQWLLRTFFTTTNPLPNVLSRTEVDQSKTYEKEYPPIRVAYKQLRERTEDINRAISTNDMKTLQRLLQGSLLPQVNEGPLKVAQAFLPNNNTAEAEKLKKAFKYFMIYSKEGIKLHSYYSTQNPIFSTLQENLEIAYENLQKELEKFC